MNDSLNLGRLWDQLLTDVSPSLGSNKRYCAVRSIRGSNFIEGRDIAIIGRAPNGWVSTFSKENVEDPNKRAELVSRILRERVCPVNDSADPRPECGPMHWLKHPFQYKGATRVNTRLGRFWPTVEDIVKDQLSDGRLDDWEESIAWTNLYLVSKVSGNPGALLERAQREASAGLLGYALRTWKPRVAIFFTEVNSADRRTLEWSRPFHETLGLTDLQYREGSSIVAAAGLSGQETRVLFVVRPDARRGIYDVRSDVKKELRSLEPGKITNS